MRRWDDSVRTPAIWLLLLAAVVGSVWVTGFAPTITWGSAWIFIREMFPPDWSVLPTVLRAMGETIGIAFLGTFIAFLLAFPFSFVTARNLGSPATGAMIRTVMAFLRSIPEMIWAIVFVIAIDFGNAAGIMALAAHNVGILTKLIGEVFEEAPTGAQEAMASTGAGRATAVWFGILPWAIPAILSHTFFRLECNIRTAAILGVVGGGGIGRELMLHRQLYQYQAMSVDIIGILVLVVASDWLGATIRKQVS